MGEIFVCGKDGNIESHCHSTNEKINMRTLNTLLPAFITSLGCQLIIGILNGSVFKKGKFLLQFLKLS